MVVVVIDATRTALRFFFNCNGIARKLELTVLSNLLWDPPLLLVVLVLRIVRSDPKRRGMSTVVFVVVGLLLEVRSGSCEKKRQITPGNYEILGLKFKNFHGSSSKKSVCIERACNIW